MNEVFLHSRFASILDENDTEYLQYFMCCDILSNAKSSYDIKWATKKSEGVKSEIGIVRRNTDNNLFFRYCLSE